jgi:hypothetical protein
MAQVCFCCELHVDQGPEAQRGLNVHLFKLLLVARGKVDCAGSRHVATAAVFATATATAAPGAQGQRPGPVRAVSCNTAWCWHSPGQHARLPRTVVLITITDLGATRPARQQDRNLHTPAKESEECSGICTCSPTD